MSDGFFCPQLIPMIDTFFVKHACGKVRHSCYYFAKVYVHVCVRTYAQICTSHNSCIYRWISKLFDTVVVLEEEQCHLKHFISSPLVVKRDSYNCYYFAKVYVHACIRPDLSRP